MLPLLQRLRFTISASPAATESRHGPKIYTCRPKTWAGGRQAVAGRPLAACWGEDIGVRADLVRGVGVGGTAMVSGHEYRGRRKLDMISGAALPLLPAVFCLRYWVWSQL